MRYTVPQFEGQEPKIAGPFTFKQFMLLVAAGVVVFMLYSIFKDNFPIFLLLSAIVVGLAISLGFVKINGRTLPQFMVDMLNYFMGQKMYVWRQKGSSSVQVFEKEVEAEEKEPVRPQKGNGRLKKLGGQIDAASKL